MTDVAVRDEILKRSVKAGDLTPIEGAGIFHIMVPAVTPAAGALPPDLPVDFRLRDRVLSYTPRSDAQWSSAIGIAITKVASMAWDVDSPVAMRGRKAQDLLLHADSVNGIGGWVPFLSKQLRDFTCTNNGCFIEIVRENSAYGSKVIGIAHLSSRHCWRTGDPEYPVIYYDRIGREHLMRWWEVIPMSDMPEPEEYALGAGLCAAERAYPQIIKLAALERYVYEKVSGTRPLAIHIVNGLTMRQLTDLIKTGRDAAEAQGMTSYMGAIVAATVKPDEPPALVTIPLAELPDGFDAEKERNRADLIYANALGLDPQDLAPLASSNLGTSTQSWVLHEKAKGRGLTAYRSNLTHCINELVLDAKTKFLFTEKDYADQERKAGIDATKIANVAAMVGQEGGPSFLTQEQGQQLLVDQDVIPKDFIPEDKTEGGAISDTDKPEADEEPGGAASISSTDKPEAETAPPQQQPQFPVSIAPPVRSKEVRFKDSVDVLASLQSDPTLVAAAEGLLRKAKKAKAKAA